MIFFNSLTADHVHADTGPFPFSFVDRSIRSFCSIPKAGRAVVGLKEAQIRYAHLAGK